MVLIPRGIARRKDVRGGAAAGEAMDGIFGTKGTPLRQLRRSLHPTQSPTDPVLRPRKTIDAAGTRAKLDDVIAAVRREAEGADAAPVDDVMVAAVAEVSKVEIDALERVRLLSRRTFDSSL